MGWTIDGGASITQSGYVTIPANSTTSSKTYNVKYTGTNCECTYTITQDARTGSTNPCGLPDSYHATSGAGGTTFTLTNSSGSDECLGFNGFDVEDGAVPMQIYGTYVSGHRLSVQWYANSYTREASATISGAVLVMDSSSHQITEVPFTIVITQDAGKKPDPEPTCDCSALSVNGAPSGFVSPNGQSGSFTYSVDSSTKPEFVAPIHVGMNQMSISIVSNIFNSSSGTGTVTYTIGANNSGERAYGTIQGYPSGCDGSDNCWYASLMQNSL